MCYHPRRCLGFLIPQAYLKQRHFIIARTTYCAETQLKPLHSELISTAKDVVVTSPPAWWLVIQQCTTRRCLSLTTWYVTLTLACRTTRICSCFFFASYNLLRYALTIYIYICMYAVGSLAAPATWASPLVAPRLTSEMLNTTQSLWSNWTRLLSHNQGRTFSLHYRRGGRCLLAA